MILYSALLRSGPCWTLSSSCFRPKGMREEGRREGKEEGGRKGEEGGREKGRGEGRRKSN